MSQSILDMLSGQLGGQAMDLIGSQIGADRSQVEKAVPAALGSLVTGLARNAQSSEGAGALAVALGKDHDGSVFDNLSGVLSAPERGSGAGVLGHVFGAKQGAVQSALGQSTGLDAGSIGKLLTMLAPLVMGALGKKQLQGGLNPSDLGGLLRQEHRSAAHARRPIWACWAVCSTPTVTATSRTTSPSSAARCSRAFSASGAERPRATTTIRQGGS